MDSNEKPEKKKESDNRFDKLLEKPWGGDAIRMIESIIDMKIAAFRFQASFLKALIYLLLPALIITPFFYPFKVLLAVYPLVFLTVQVTFLVPVFFAHLRTLFLLRNFRKKWGVRLDIHSLLIGKEEKHTFQA